MHSVVISVFVNFFIVLSFNLKHGTMGNHEMKFIIENDEGNEKRMKRNEQEMNLFVHKRGVIGNYIRGENES